MDFVEVIKQARALLQSEGRITYRTLKRQFALDDESLEDLKEQLIDADRVAVDEEGRILVWVSDGDATAAPPTAQSQPQSQPPASYTPQHLAERILAEQAAMESRGSANGERKTITALFADLKGSTALIEGLDPEDARAIIDPALQLMMDAVHRYDGYVAQALGDGIFALFGAPIAHEDHPQRALYAALRMQEEMHGHSDQVRLKHGVPLSMRVGINTGEVVVRSIRKDDLHTDYVPVGHSTNLAARMEQMATPGSIVISEYTRKLTEGYFELKALGAADIKGVEEPLNIYEVLGAGPLRTRLQVAARRGLTRFVGRHNEMDQLQRALEQAKAGHGQIVGVIGEPGLGKSRLFHEFKLTSQSDCLVLEAFSVSHGKASPYLPLIELLKAYFQIESQDDERSRRERIIGKVLGLDRSLEDTLPYLFSLLGIVDPQSSLQQMDAQIRRRRTFEALKKLLLRESLNQPLLLIFEDLHWTDTETQGFLDALSESVASANLLLLVNYRPEYRSEWGQKTYYSQLRLVPLGPAEAEELLTFLLGRDVSLKALTPLILERTEGTPFFMEEVVQTLVEEGSLVGERGHYHLETTPSELHISPTVQGVLAARIDRLTAAEKALLQQLAVIGRQFPLRLIQQVIPQSEAELYHVLSSLQAKEFLYEQPAFPEVEYFFKHALTQEVAYGMLLQEQRKALHERTGQAMETLYEASVEDHSSALARHYQLSGNAEKAVEYLHLAGQQAVQRSAHAEAMGLFSLALEVLQTLPSSPPYAQQELLLQTALGAALLATKGYGAPETEHVYTRAYELCQQVGETTQLFPILWMISSFYVSRLDYGQYRTRAEQFWQLAERVQDPIFLLWAPYLSGWGYYAAGQHLQAREHYELAVARYAPHQHRAATLSFGQDPGVTSRCMLANVLLWQGYPDQARRSVEEAVSLAQEVAHPYSLAFALGQRAFIAYYRRDVQDLRQYAEAAIAYASEQGFPYWTTWCSVFLGGAKVEQGEREKGLAQIRQALSTLWESGTRIGWTSLLSVLITALREMEQTEEAFKVVGEALALATQTGEHFHEPELYRLKGELTLQANSQSPEPKIKEAEDAFQQAIDVARRHDAKFFELRAVTSLARLWQQQGRTTEARDLLAPVYNWFTEGFDTADLKDANALLDLLAEGV